MVVNYIQIRGVPQIQSKRGASWCWNLCQMSLEKDRGLGTRKHNKTGHRCKKNFFCEFLTFYFYLKKTFNWKALSKHQKLMCCSWQLFLNTSRPFSRDAKTSSSSYMVTKLDMCNCARHYLSILHKAMSTSMTLTMTKTRPTTFQRDPTTITLCRLLRPRQSPRHKHFLRHFRNRMS